MILVTGATGHNGSEIVALLANRGIPARAMVRDLSKAASLPRDIEAVKGDFSDPESLIEALQGIDHAFLVTPPAADAAAWQTSFLEAAKQTGLQHLVKLSVLGADPHSPSRFQRAHGEAEEEVEASGIAWTHLRPNVFWQSIPEYVQGDSLYVTSEKARVSGVDLRDIAAVAVAALTEPGHQGQRYEITGSEALTYQEMAKQLSVATGKQIQMVYLPAEQGRAAMLAQGIPEWNVEGILELNRWFETPEAAKVTDVVDRVGKKKPMTFAESLTSPA